MRAGREDRRDEGFAPAQAEPGFRRPADGHLVISGTGRAGTTLLVRIFTALGLDTGFDRAAIVETEANLGRAGLERLINAETAREAPDVIKNPLLMNFLDDGLTQGWFKVAHAIIPVRDLVQAAGSRRSVGRAAEVRGLAPKEVPGGLWLVNQPKNQEQLLARKFHHLVETLVRHRVPMTFLSFPRFALDADDFLAALGPLLRGRYGLDDATIRAAHAAETRPELIGTHA